jgi:hypothetical protein
MGVFASVPIDFTESRGDLNGFADGWFFFVYRSFKPALDIHYSEIIDAPKTLALRDRLSQKLGFESLAHMQQSIKASGKSLSASKDNKSVMQRSVKISIESQGNPPAFAFRESDTFESKCGNWAVQVAQAKPDTRAGRKKDAISEGSVGFQLYARSPSGSSNVWVESAWHICSQREFANLLRYGFMSGTDLRATGTSDGIPPTEQADLFAAIP